MLPCVCVFILVCVAIVRPSAFATGKEGSALGGDVKGGIRIGWFNGETRLCEEIWRDWCGHYDSMNSCTGVQLDGRAMEGARRGCWVVNEKRVCEVGAVLWKVWPADHSSKSRAFCGESSAELEERWLGYQHITVKRNRNLVAIMFLYLQLFPTARAMMLDITSSHASDENDQ